MAEESVNEFQQVDVAKIRQWIKDGGDLMCQLTELLDLVESADFLKEIQKAREDQVVDEMLAEAGFPPTRKDKDAQG